MSDEMMAHLRRAAELWLEESDLDHGWESGDGTLGIRFWGPCEDAFMRAHKERFPEAHLGPDPRLPRPSALTVGEMPGDGEFVVYFHLDDRGSPLYIGKTSHYRQRQNTHRSRAPWWEEIASIHVERFESAEDMDVFEVLAIRRLRPLCNITHNEASC